MTSSTLDRRHVLLAASVAATVAAGVSLAVVWRHRHRAGVLPTTGSYEATEVTGWELAPGTAVRLTFDGDRLHVYAGGNNMTGTTMLTGPRLYWSEDASTQAGLLPNQALQDAWISKWLNGGVDVFRNGRSLVLSRGDTRLELWPSPDRD